jgi:hypothetical protein
MYNYLKSFAYPADIETTAHILSIQELFEL